MTTNNDNLLLTSSDSIHSLTNADTCKDKIASAKSDHKLSTTNASIWLKRASLVLSTATNDSEESEPAVQQELMEVTQLLTEAPVVMESAASLLLLTSNNPDSPQQQQEEEEDMTRRKRARQELLPNNNDFQLRRGKWTSEEEAYVLRLVRDFNDGCLDVVVPGMTLRTFLSQALRCDPMRITKKFTGDLSIGKRMYHPSKEKEEQQDRESRREELKQLKDAWNQRMILQEQEAAAALLAKQNPENSILSSSNNNGLDEIKLTADWLDRAATVLMDTWNNRHSPLSSSLDSSSSSDSWCRTNLKQIQQLLMEAKDVQETCAKLPQLIQSVSKSKKT